MLTHPTLDQLNQLGLHGMARAFGELVSNDETVGLTHADCKRGSAPTFPGAR